MRFIPSRDTCRQVLGVEVCKDFPCSLTLLNRERNAGGACPGGFVLKHPFVGVWSEHKRDARKLRFKRSQTLIVQAIGRDKTW